MPRIVVPSDALEIPISVNSRSVPNRSSAGFAYMCISPPSTKRSRVPSPGGVTATTAVGYQCDLDATLPTNSRVSPMLGGASPRARARNHSSTCSVHSKATPTFGSGCLA